MSDRYIPRLFLALTASALLHTLLLGTQGSAVNGGKVGQTTSNSLHITLTPAEKSRPHRENVPHERTAKPARPAAPEMRKSPASASTPGKAAPDSPARTEPDTARAVGAALENMVSRQYMMLRMQQFLSLARSGANALMRSRLTPEELFRHRGKHCTLRLLAAPAPEHGYLAAQPECDDPALADALLGMPWNTTMPLPSDYSLPYRGLTVNMEIGAFDIAIGLEPIVD